MEDEEEGKKLWENQWMDMKMFLDMKYKQQ